MCARRSTLSLCRYTGRVCVLMAEFVIVERNIIKHNNNSIDKFMQITNYNNIIYYKVCIKINEDQDILPMLKYVVSTLKRGIYDTLL